MKLISTLAAAATMFAATSIVPVGAVTPAPIDTAQMSPAENVAMVCREVCRGGFCRERCRWRPDGPRVHVYGDGYRAYGRYYYHRSPGIELRIR
jgi:hypothetical protein